MSGRCCRCPTGAAVLGKVLRTPPPTTCKVVQSSLSSQSIRRRKGFAPVEHPRCSSASCSIRLRVYHSPAHASSKLSGPFCLAISACLRRSNIRPIRLTTMASARARRNWPPAPTAREPNSRPIATNPGSRTSIGSDLRLFETNATMEVSGLRPLGGESTAQPQHRGSSPQNPIKSSNPRNRICGCARTPLLRCGDGIRRGGEGTTCS
jgi:hypothetical protein